MIAVGEEGQQVRALSQVKAATYIEDLSPDEGFARSNHRSLTDIVHISKVS